MAKQLLTGEEARKALKAGIDQLADDEVSDAPKLYNNLNGLYLYDGVFQGVFSRLGPLPTISKDMQGMTAATIWVD